MTEKQAQALACADAGLSGYAIARNLGVSAGLIQKRLRKARSLRASQEIAQRSHTEASGRMNQIIVELDDGYELRFVDSLGMHLEGEVVHPNRPDFRHTIRVTYKESIEDSVNAMTRIVQLANDVVKEEVAR